MGRTYLNVPYEEKEEAKGLGAKWDARIKKWYVPAYDKLKPYAPFSRWLLDDRSSVVMVRRGIYLMESKKKCWKCGRETPVVALALTTFAEIEADDGEFYIDDNMKESFPRTVALAWAPDEESVPLRLMKFMKRYYHVKDGYSKTSGKCLANHCAHCGAIQGNHYLFGEPDSPFWPGDYKKMQDLKIHFIAFQDNLLLNWDVYSSFSESEYPDVKKDGPIDIGGLSDPKNPVYDYGMLYGID